MNSKLNSIKEELKLKLSLYVNLEKEKNERNKYLNELENKCRNLEDKIENYNKYLNELENK